MRTRTSARSIGRPKGPAGPIALVLLAFVAALLTVVVSRDDRIQTAIAQRPATADPLTFGVLGSTCDADRARALHQAGVKVAQMDIEWQRFEPEPGLFSQDYISELNTNFGNCQAAGLEVSVGLGLSYAPGWVVGLPDGRYINQFGDGFSESITTPGNTGDNAPIVGSFRPEQALSTFVGGPARGYWTLIVQDVAGGDIGQIDALSLNLTYRYKARRGR
jgi:hypothetical protein